MRGWRLGNRDWELKASYYNVSTYRCKTCGKNPRNRFDCYILTDFRILSTGKTFSTPHDAIMSGPITYFWFEYKEKSVTADFPHGRLACGATSRNQGFDVKEFGI